MCSLYEKVFQFTEESIPILCKAFWFCSKAVLNDGVIFLDAYYTPYTRSHIHTQHKHTHTPAHMYTQAEELQHLIASQPSSIEAVRLRTFVPSHPYPLEAPDFLNKFEVRAILLREDSQLPQINCHEKVLKP